MTIDMMLDLLIFAFFILGALALTIALYYGNKYDKCGCEECE